MDIFKLVGSIFVDTDKANENLDKTDKKASGLGGTLAKMGKGAAVAGSAIVSGAGLAVGGIMKLAKETAASTDEIDKMSQRLGLSRAAYQELDFALSQSGVDINSFQTGMKTLLASMDKVSEGNKTATENFEKLGISVVNADGSLRAEEDVLFDTISAFQAMENSSEKTRLAQELFGKQGQEIIPLLNAESESIDDMRQKARDLGLVLSDETIDAGVEMTDTMDQLKRASGSLVAGLGSALMPLVQQFSAFLLENLPAIRSMINALTPVIQLVFSAASNVLTYVMQYVPPILSTVTNVITDIIGGITRGTAAAGQTFERFRQKVSTVFSAIKDAVKTPINAILGFINGLIRGVAGGVNGIIRALNKLHVDVPGWVTALTGVQSLGFNIAEVTAPQIPLLAKGGVLSDGVAIVGEDGPELIQASSRKTTVTPLNDNNNGFVELSKKLDTLIEIMSNGFGVRLDTGAMVGQLAPAMDMELGSLAYNARRYV